MARTNKLNHPSTNTRKSDEIIKWAESSGLLPLEVMLDNMNFYFRQAMEAQFTLLTRGLWMTEGDDPYEIIFDGINHLIELRKRAGNEAARAARYVHPRLGPMDEAGLEADEDFIPLAERLKEYARRDALNAAMPSR